MGLKLLLTIRTANRAPKRNYLGETVRSLIAQGVDRSAIHLYATDHDVRWLSDELRGVAESASITHGLRSLNVPDTRWTANANGIQQVSALSKHDADWIVMAEDDLEWCADPLGSMARWLEDYATPNRLIYRFFTFGQTKPVSAHAALSPLREMRGSQVVALRAEDARRFAAWARQHPLDWRPKDAPFQDRPNDGFDKLLGYWALQDRPSMTTGLVSRPFFVRHLGVESSLHSHGVRMDQHFAGVDWSYQRKVAA